MCAHPQARTIRVTPKSVKRRLADALGLKCPAVGRTIPTVRSCAGSGGTGTSGFLERMRSDPTTLNIMGDRDELDPYM